MTSHWFKVEIARLFVLKGVPNEHDSHFEALKDIPEAILSAAIGLALKTRVWFPTPAELRADADAVIRDVANVNVEPARDIDLANAKTVTIHNPFGGKDLHLKVTKDWYTDCDACSDSGWAERWCGEGQVCPWLLRRHCGRRRAHGGHFWVESCVCIDTNPTIRRRKQALAKYSRAPEKVA